MVPTTSNNGGSSLAKEEADFFNQSVPSEAEKAKLTKDSIMALYGAKSSQPMTNASMLGGPYPQNQFPQQNFGNFGLTVGNHPAHPPQQFNFNPQAHSQGFGNGAMIPPVQAGVFPGFQPSLNAFPTASTPGLMHPAVNPAMLINNKNGGFPVQVQSMQFPPQFAVNRQTGGQFLPPSGPTPSVVPTVASTAPPASLNQQFGGLNLGNVWQ